MASENIFIILFLRFVNGIGASYISVFVPVWIDQFSLKSSAPIMMIAHNLSSIIGNIIGFSFTSALSVRIGYGLSYLVQSLLLGLMLFVVFFLKSKYFDKRIMRIKQTSYFYRIDLISQEDAIKKVSCHSASADSETNSNRKASSIMELDKGTDIRQLNFIPITDSNEIVEVPNTSIKLYSTIDTAKLLFKNTIYVRLSLCLSLLLFVSTFMLLWIKKYFTEVIKINEGKAELSIIFALVSAPILGISTGGSILKRMGGYHKVGTLYIGSFVCLICFCLGFIIFFITNYYAFSVLLWTYIFFGAMLDPCINGAILSSLPADLKGSGYSLQYFMSSIIGVMPSTFVYGFLYEETKLTMPTFAMSFCLSVPIFIGFNLFLSILREKIRLGLSHDSDLTATDPKLECID